MDEIAGKRIAVIGLAATGLAAASALQARGARVTVYDARPEESLSPETVAAARARDIAVLAACPEPDWTDVDLVVPSPGVPRNAPVLVEATRRSVPILGEIEVAYRLAQAPILAITGTNGKTTTTALLGAICREAGLKTWVAGNIAEDAGRRLPLIQAAVEAPADAVIVAEISSFQLEWVERFRPRVAAWLNVTNDHLDRHADLEEYAGAKARIFAAQRAGDVAVLNGDDETVLRASGGGGQRWIFSLEKPQAVGAFLDGDRLRVRMPDGRDLDLMGTSEIPIPGRHNVANVLAAAAMALAFGIAPQAIVAGVKSFAGVAHRMEPVDAIDGVRYVNNSMCTNPVAVAASLEAAGGPVIAIAGGKHKGGDLGPMARALKSSARQVVLIGVSSPEIAEALAREGMEDVRFARTLPEAVDTAAALARPGDTVMLVPGCASFDMFRGFEHRGQVFRDAVGALRERTAVVATVEEVR